MARINARQFLPENYEAGFTITPGACYKRVKLRILGYDLKFNAKLVKAAAPLLPAKRSDGALTEILPPFGTNPPGRPATIGSSDLTQRDIHNDPRELWYLALPSKLTPSQIVMILRAALGGDVWQQWQLMSLMLDTWPTLRKCIHELRQAVSTVSYRVKPYADEGKEATASAKQKADFVAKAFKQFNPDPFTDEEGFTGTVYDACDAVLNGLTMQEVLWEQRGGDWYPRATAWVHPRHFTFTNDGKIAVFDDMYNRLQYNNTKTGQGPDPNKFICGQFKSRSGSSLGAGFMRPLAWYWSAVVFNREWCLKFAQKYGNPFLDLTYKAATELEKQAFIQLAAEAGNQGFCVHPDGTTLNIIPAQTLGTSNPQVEIMKMADEACMLLLLGQTGTTKSVPGKLGNEDTHNDVKQENIQGISKWVAGGPLQQLARACVRVNWGPIDQEVPTVEADFTGPADPMEEAQRDAVMLTNKVPMDAEEFYQRHNMKQPEQGDLVIVGGQLGRLGALEEVGQNPEPPVPPGGLPVNNPDGEKPSPGKPNPDDNFKATIAKATDEELGELRELLIKAKAAPYANGEWEAVKVKINGLKARF